MSAENETKEELLRCSHCKCWKLPEYFSKNVRGVLYKTCEKCRHKYRCEQCEDKFFTSKRELLRHKNNVHTKIKDYHCKECKSSFSDTRDLRRHIRGVHLNIKPHKCGQCDSCFSETSGLQNHIKAIHLKIKDHHCQKCEMSFSTPRALLVHNNVVHLKIKDYFCPDCEYSSSTRANLEYHIKTVHLNIRDHQCTKCEYRCYDKYILEKHLKICTGNNSSISGLEMRCKEALTDLGFVEDVDYIYNHTFSKLTDYCGQPLRPDFRFINYKIMIECDGSQHYKVKEFGASKEKAVINFEQIKANDKVKDEFCDQFGYKMIRIPYWDIMNMIEILSVELYDIVEW